MYGSYRIGLTPQLELNTVGGTSCPAMNTSPRYCSPIVVCVQVYAATRLAGRAGSPTCENRRRLKYVNKQMYGSHRIGLTPQLELNTVGGTSCPAMMNTRPRFGDCSYRELSGVRLREPCPNIQGLAQIAPT